MIDWQDKGSVMALRELLAVPLIAALGMAALPSAAVASSDQPSRYDLFQVGKTGILCYQEPCPRRGIVPLSSEGAAARWPVWSGQQPPALQGRKSERRQIEAAWAEDRCLTVEGALIGGTLKIRRIVRPC